MTALERLALTLADQEVTQNTFTGTEDSGPNENGIRRVLPSNRFRRGMVIRHAGGTGSGSSGGLVRIRYEEEQQWRDEEAAHLLPPGAQLTFAAAGEDTPRQEVQCKFPAEETVISVVEWSLVPPRRLVQVAQQIGITG